MSMSNAARIIDLTERSDQTITEVDLCPGILIDEPWEEKTDPMELDLDEMSLLAVQGTIRRWMDGLCTADEALLTIRALTVAVPETCSRTPDGL
jgi:hypothetical protein